MDSPAGDSQLLPRLPRPFVCRSAATSVPEGAPSSASRRARMLVESTSARQTTFCPTQRVCRRL